MSKNVFLKCNGFKLLSYILFFSSVLILNFNLEAKEKPLSKTLEGYQVKFDYEKYPIEREIAYQYCKDYYNIDKNENPIQKNEIGIDLYDIDNDGKKEILTYLNKSSFCGSAGCTFRILKPLDSIKDNKHYQRIPINTNIHEKAEILDSITQGYHDIKLESTIWRWNGEKYEPYKKK